MKKILLTLIAVFVCFSHNLAHADEGMWMLNKFPEKKVKLKYNVEINKDWLQHAMLSSVRIAGGCSASFVSDNGLVMTNHHCSHACIEQLSNSSKDYVTTGFFAKSFKDEVRCPEIEINKLIEIKDVTKEILDATKNLDDKESTKKMKLVRSKIENECSAGSDLFRCEVVSLYRGGLYHLYKYQRYQDVRLVFAPEFSAAFFGGDPDNFTFPRYDLDVSFLRVYENGAPLASKDFFKWSKQGPQENEFSLVIGNPGSTSRQMTVAEVEFLRQYSIIDSLTYLAELKGFLNEFATRGPEQKRISNGQIFGVENSLKAKRGRYTALMDPKFLKEKTKQEKILKAKVNSDPRLKKQYGTAWKEVDEAYSNMRRIYKEYDAVERNSLGSKLYSFARSLVRYSEEIEKPSGMRYFEFVDARLPQLKQSILSGAPIYDELEIASMSFNLKKMRERLGPDHPIIKKLLGVKSPEEVAAELIKNTKLKDVKIREQLWAGGKKAVDESTDPLIKFFKSISEDTRKIRDYYEENVDTKLRKASEKIAKAQFAVYGDSLYPNATFSMRISYGQIKGYEENGTVVKPFTNFQGAFDRHSGREPFALPDSWLNSKSKIDLKTSLNFASTNDIIGGNSGSPVVNKEAEIIGLIFDGNIQSLGGDYYYDESVNRAVSVSSDALLEALKKIYSADRIVEEIEKSSK